MELVSRAWVGVRWRLVQFAQIKSPSFDHTPFTNPNNYLIDCWVLAVNSPQLLPSENFPQLVGERNRLGGYPVPSGSLHLIANQWRYKMGQFLCTIHTAELHVGSGWDWTSAWLVLFPSPLYSFYLRTLIDSINHFFKNLIQTLSTPPPPPREGNLRQFARLSEKCASTCSVYTESRSSIYFLLGA